MTTQVRMAAAGVPPAVCPQKQIGTITEANAAVAKKLVEPRTPLQKRVHRLDTASTACESSSDLCSTILAPQTSNAKMMSPMMLPRGRVSAGNASTATPHTVSASPMEMSREHSSLDWMVDLCSAVGTPMTVEDGHLYPKLSESKPKIDAVAESDESEDAAESLPAALANLKVSLCQQPKLRGEAFPVFHAIKKHKEKDCSEENHFGLCEHYQSQLEKALEFGFGAIKWHCDFNLHHLAAKRNNMEMLQFLLSKDVEPVHAIDDFGRKPIDYACSKKRDTVYYLLESVMSHVPAPDTDQERLYQDIKLGICKVKKEKKEGDMTNIAESSLSMDNVAEGVVALKRPDDLLTAYEAEKQCPAEYSKIVKQLCNGAGWDSIQQWPRGTSLLHWAARNGKEELCRFLVFEFRVDTRDEDICGRSCIYYAKLKKHRKLAKKLISNFGFF